MERLLFLTYLGCLSLTSAFALTTTLTVPVVISVISVGVFFAWGALNRDHSLVLEIDDIVLLLFLLAVYIGFFLNQDRFRSSKPINHIIAYSYVVLVNYYLLKNVCFYLCKKFGPPFVKRCYGAISIGVIITCLFGIAEFWLKNAYGIDVDSYVPRPAVTEYDPWALGSFIRLRSFVEESGHLAFFLEVFGPISLYSFRNNNYVYFPLLILLLVCFVLTFSTAGWLIAAFTYLLLAVTRIRPQELLKRLSFNFRTFTRYLLLGGGVMLVILLSYDIVNYILEVLDNIILSKIFLSGSAEDRTTRYLEGFNALMDSNLLELTFGNGPAVYETLGFSRGGTILLYLTIVLESGLLGLLSFLLFCAILFYKAVRIPILKLRLALLFGLLSALLHFFIIANYWYPWLWILAIIIQVNYRMYAVKSEMGLRWSNN